MQIASISLLVFTLGPRRELRRRLLPAVMARFERDLHEQGLAAALAALRRPAVPLPPGQVRPALSVCGTGRGPPG